MADPQPFFCYRVDDDEIGQFKILPAGRKREWMNETEEAFAYRCLPLTMANQHGWELRSPVGFEAVWDGGIDRSALTIKRDGPGATVDTHFGSGVLTFNVSAIFRTPPGYNLWISGPANTFKDGIQCMSAMIETDWMPYTFSVNWKFTRPDHPIRFEADEPFCQIFPVERGLVERLDPQERMLSEAPDIQRQFHTGMLKRNAKEVRRRLTGQKDDALRWQGWYMRGLLPDESEEFPDHQSALKVPPFRKP